MKYSVSTSFKDIDNFFFLVKFESKNSKTKIKFKQHSNYLFTKLWKDKKQNMNYFSYKPLNFYIYKYLAQQNLLQEK